MSGAIVTIVITWEVVGLVALAFVSVLAGNALLPAKSNEEQGE